MHDRNVYAKNGLLLARLKKMVVANSRLNTIRERTEALLGETMGLLADDLLIEEADAAPGTTFAYTELPVMSIIGPSGSTKTTSMLRVAEDLKKKNGGTPVLVVKCRSNTRTMKSLQGLILEAFGDPQAKSVLAKQFGDRYEQDVVTRSIRKVARAAGTFVVVLDEAHTPLGKARGKQLEWAAAIAPHLKSLVNDGLFSIVVMGTADAELFFATNDELNNRRIEGVSLEPVDLRKPGDYDYFYKFVGRIDRQMVDDGIVDERIGLIDDVRSRATIYDLSQGIPGTVSRVLLGALRIAQREERRIITWNDIKEAFWVWKGEQLDENGEPIEIYDPFVSQPRPTTLEVIREISKSAA